MLKFYLHGINEVPRDGRRRDLCEFVHICIVCDFSIKSAQNQKNKCNGIFINNI